MRILHRTGTTKRNSPTVHAVQPPHNAARVAPAGWEQHATLLPVDSPSRAAANAAESSPVNSVAGLSQADVTQVEWWRPILARFEAAALREWLARPAGQLGAGDVWLWVDDEGAVALSMPGLKHRRLGGPVLAAVRVLAARGLR